VTSGNRKETVTRKNNSVIVTVIHGLNDA
jgi:hypothetical protein